MLKHRVGGGTERFIVHGTNFTGATFDVDKTYAEIAEAYQRGAEVVADVQVYSIHYIVPLVRLLTTEADFGGVYYDSTGATDKLGWWTFSLATDGTVTFKGGNR